MENEFKSFFKTVDGGEGGRCNYPTRLDTYGRGCSHNCEYCYARSLLEFRGMWKPQSPAVADPEKVRRKISRLKRGSIVRLGGMTDCFQPAERVHGVTYETIKALNDQGIGYLIVTKSALVADDKYIGALDKELAHIQISITSTSDEMALRYEKADPVSVRIKAAEKLEKLGYDVALRVSPYIPEYIDVDVINAVRCEKVLVEFLRSNAFIRKTFPIDYSEYSLRAGNYRHLPLEKSWRYFPK